MRQTQVIGKEDGIYPMGSTRRSVRWDPRRPSWTCGVLAGDVSSRRRLGECRGDFFHLDSISLMRKQAFLIIMRPVRAERSAVKPLKTPFYWFQCINCVNQSIPVLKLGLLSHLEDVMTDFWWDFDIVAGVVWFIGVYAERQVKEPVLVCEDECGEGTVNGSGSLGEFCIH